MWFGLPDQGFMGLAEIADHTARIRDAVDVPLIVDADTGFGLAVPLMWAGFMMAPLSAVVLPAGTAKRGASSCAPQPASTSVPVRVRAGLPGLPWAGTTPPATLPGRRTAYTMPPPRVS